MAQETEERIVQHIAIDGTSYKLSDSRLDEEIEKQEKINNELFAKLDSYNFDTEVVVVTESFYNEIEHREDVFYFLYEEDDEEGGNGGSSGGDDKPNNPPVNPPTFNGMTLEINAPYDTSIWGAVFTNMTNVTYSNWQINFN